MKSNNNNSDMHHAQPHAQSCTSSIFSAKFVLSSLPSVPVAHRSSALLQTYLWMVSSAWLAWSKCPPLHPCCHRGNQADQTTQRVMVLDFTAGSCGLYLPHQLCTLKRVFFFVKFLVVMVSDLPQKHDSSPRILISFSKHTHRLLLRHSLRFCASHSSAAFPPLSLLVPCPPHALVLLWAVGNQGDTQ